MASVFAKIKGGMQWYYTRRSKENVHHKDFPGNISRLPQLYRGIYGGMHWKCVFSVKNTLTSAPELPLGDCGCLLLYTAVSLWCMFSLLSNDWFGNNAILKETWTAVHAHKGPLLPAWISNYIHYKMWDEIIYLFLNFNGATVEV